MVEESSARLFLVRHGSTRMVRQKRYQGWGDARLDVEGRKQARRAASALASVPLGAVFSSDLRRARETADTIAAVHGLRVTLLPALRELNFGAWEGRTWEEISGRWPDRWSQWLADPLQTAPPGGENHCGRWRTDFSPP